MNSKTKNKNMRVPYGLAVYGKEEVNAVNRVLKEPTKISFGFHTKQFEKKIAGVFGKRYGIMVNSGSSANLLAFEILNLPRGSEVITPIFTFSTTLAPIIQKGLVPVFVDVQEGTYLIDIDQIERLITKKTRALMIPSLIGSVPDMARLQKIARKHKLFFIEDSCDTLGARFAGKPTGYYSDISTTSFYASHIITAAAGGGMACFHDNDLSRRALLKSNWGRESTLFGPHEKSENLRKRWAGKIERNHYDAKFIFSEIGYNFQPSEIHAAFGLEQLKRFTDFFKKRQKNFSSLLNFFQKYEDLFILPKQHPRAEAAWLAFPLTIRTTAGFSRKELTYYLERHNIQTRPIFTGNALRQPAFHDIRARRMRKGYPVADSIMRNGFLIGCHHGLTEKDVDYIKEIFENYLKTHDYKKPSL